MKVANQFRIGIYPFIQYLNANYFPLTSSINGSATNPSTINYAAANLASLLDTDVDASLGSGGTHIDTAITSMNSAITSVGTGAASNNTLPYVFLVTDGAQDPQTKGVPNGGWNGSNHATVIDPSICTALEEPRHHRFRALHSLSADQPGEHLVCQQRGFLCQLEYSEYSSQPEGLRVD